MDDSYTHRHQDKRNFPQDYDEYRHKRPRVHPSDNHRERRHFPRAYDHYGHHRQRVTPAEFLDEVITVKQINKRVLGKIMIKYCGHEGTAGTRQSNSLRKLLQTCIDNIQHYRESVWADADITVYDMDDNTFRIISGHGKHKFIVSENNGSPEIVKITGRGHRGNEEACCTVI